jgi:hypothetical protein
MENVALTRQAVPALPPEIKALNAGSRHADCIRVVTMRGKRPTMEARLHALDALKACAIPDVVSSGHVVSSLRSGFAGAI